MATRHTGFALLASNSVQESNDLATVAHLASIKASIPFVHFFDGMRLSHEFNKIDTFSTEELKSLYDFDALRKWRNSRIMNADKPTVRGGVENSDVFWQIVQAAEPYFKKVPECVEQAMEQIYELCGRRYNLFDYSGAPDAEIVVVAMGSGVSTLEEVVQKVVPQGEKVGVVKVRLFRPFSVEHLIKAIPETVKTVIVLDKTKEPGSSGEPLYLDVAAALGSHRPQVNVFGGIYGLGGKEFTPTHALSVFRFAATSPRHGFTVNIDDDVGHSNIPVVESITTLPEGTKQSVFYALGADGTVGSNKAAAQLIADETDLFCQAYFQYDAKKSGGFTVSHLRFGPEPIKAPYMIEDADYVACHNPSYLSRYDMVKRLKKNGTFVLNSHFSAEQMETELPDWVKKSLAQKNAKFYNIDAAAIAKSVGLTGRINMIMQTVFFQLSDVLPIEKAIALLKESVVKTYGKKGEEVVNMNMYAIDQAIAALVPIEYPKEWADLTAVRAMPKFGSAYVDEVVVPTMLQEGDSIPVSKFSGIAGGIVPTNTTKVEKRDVSVTIPEWDASKCIQCNECSTVCAHAAIRPFLLSDSELEGLKLKGGPKGEDLTFRIQVSPYDCLGCTVCVAACPKDALSMIDADAETKSKESENWESALNQPSQADKFKTKNIRETAFKDPMIEFSAACTGCAETKYAKMITQLFGNRLHMANACGCSMVWSSMFPTNPWTQDPKGRGPVYSGTLFEDAAEFGFGMTVSIKERRNNLIKAAKELVEGNQVEGQLKELLIEWITEAEGPGDCVVVADKISDLLDTMAEDKALYPIVDNQSLLRRPSSWIIGGDGWAYDIGYGGLMHVLSSGEDVNVFIFDTEVYSNTGGQVSKATSRAAQAKFASTGKKSRKKDIGTEILMMRDVYVASVAIGANPTQTLKALKEAEAYPGPSVVIGYCPCLNHMIKKGMGAVLTQAKLAVDSGYWPLYRYNPLLANKGKSPLVIDSKPPKTDLRDFLSTEVRFTALQQADAENAELLAGQLQEDLNFRNSLLFNFKAFFESMIKK
ncbi:hypothetical protein GEMRC1_013732 [Eukaryota sp. GEM-RC1]